MVYMWSTMLVAICNIYIIILYSIAVTSWNFDNALLTAMLHVRHLFYLSLTVMHALKVWKAMWVPILKLRNQHVLMESRFTHQMSLQIPLVLNLTNLVWVLHILRSHYQHSYWRCSGSSLHLTSAHWGWWVWSCLLLENSPHHIAATLLSHFLSLSPTGSSKVLFQWLQQWM